MKKACVLGIQFDVFDAEALLDKAMEIMKRRDSEYAVTPNAEIAILCRKDAELKRAVDGASLILPDGIGIIYASRITGERIERKLAGVDFGEMLLKRLTDQDMSLYLLGAKPGVAEKAAENIRKRYPNICISGLHDGYFTDDSAITEEINSLSPDLLMVCLGAPKQEYWMSRYAGKLNTGLMIGLGGALDVYAGTARRAPKAWIDLGLEWLYRLIKEPKRIKRMIRLPLILLYAAEDRKKNKKSGL